MTVQTPLRRWMRSHEMGTRILAQRSGIPRSELQRIAAGACDPRASSVLRLRELTGLAVEDLAGRVAIARLRELRRARERAGAT